MKAMARNYLDLVALSVFTIIMNISDGALIHTEPLLSKDGKMLVTPMSELPTYEVEFPFNKSCEFEYLAAPRINTTHNYHISLYYHVGMIRNWLNVIYDQLDTLERCGLGYLAKELIISVNSNAPETAFDDLSIILEQYDFTRALQSIRFLRSAHPKTYEWTIMQDMRSNNCLQNINSTVNHIIYYFHTKGVGRYTTDWMEKKDMDVSQPRYWTVLLWRKFMEFFIIERPTLCLRALLFHGARACGVNLHGAHYSGNFWATTCDWVTHLNNTKPEGSGHAIYSGAEMWIGNQGVDINKTTLLDLFQNHLHLYLVPIFPTDYEPILTNKSMWPDHQVVIWQDYINGLTLINKTQW